MHFDPMLAIFGLISLVLISPIDSYFSYYKSSPHCDNFAQIRINTCLNSHPRQQSFLSKLNKVASYTLIPLLLLDISPGIMTIPVNAVSTSQPTPLKGFQTKSGLKYFDISVVEEGPTPQYGQLVGFTYKTYFKPGGVSINSNKLELIDSSEAGGNNNQPFLNKHGNNRLIKAIDEALHTMHVGSKRRIIVPNKLGYIDVGVGPMPLEPEGRKKLGRVLDYVKEGAGDLVMDLDLVYIADDENDQGYYDDVPVPMDQIQESIRLTMASRPTPEQVREMSKSIKDTGKPTSK